MSAPVALAAGNDRRCGAALVALLTIGVAGATAMRTGLAGARGAASMPAAVAFAAVLLLLASAAGWRPGRPSPGGIAAGAVAGGALVALAQLRSGAVLPRGSGIPLAALEVWAPAVALVAAAEEVVLRGALFDASLRAAGAPAALLLTSALFALIHLPLYGVVALPLDLGVGIWLGGLRLAGAGVTAPVTAHAVADLASGLLA